MSYAIVFSSKTGNTKLLADTLHACLPQEISSKKRELFSAQGPKNAFLIYPNAYGWLKIA